MKRTILYLFLLCALPALCGEFYSRRINSDIGLPDNNVRSLALDKQGFLWLGTPNGLYRYDGYFYTRFRHDSDNALLFSNHINALKSLQSGLLLVRQQGDLYSLYDVDRCRWIDMSFMGKSPQFRYYAEVDSVLWLWDDGGAAVAYRYADGQLTCDFYNSGDVPHPERDSRGYRMALRLLGNDGWNNIIFDNRQNPCVIDRTGRLIWFERESGKQVLLQVFNPELVPLVDSRKYVVCTSLDGHYTWVSTNGCGLTVYDHFTSEVKRITAQSGIIATDFVIAMIMDDNGNVFTCNDAHGVDVIATPRQNAQQLLLFPDAPVFRANRVAALCKLDNGLLVCNTVGNVLWLDTATLQMHAYVPMDGHDVHTVLRTRDSVLWVGTRQLGLRNNRDERYTNDPDDPHSIASNNVIDLYEDTDGRLWIANYTATLDLKSDNGFMHFFPEAKGFRVLRQDRHGRMWAGSRNGLYIFDPDRLMGNPSAYSLPLSGEQTNYSDISDLCEDEQGNMWVSTLGDGVYCLKGDTILSHVTAAAGLISDYVHALITDLNGTVWMATNRGITCYASDSGEMTYIYDGYNILHNIYSDHTAFRLPDGRLLFGTDEGISVYTPGQTVVSEIPQPHLTELLVNNDPWNKLHPTEEAIFNQHHITLRHNENTLTFRFSAFDYHTSVGSIYSYMLDGYDSEWSDMQAYSFAQFRNLHPGHYVFRVRAFNSSNAGEECALIIDILRPWWATWWAILLYCIATAAFTWAIVYQRKHTEALHNKLKLEQQLTEYKMLFFTNISHEFRTPLTIIRSAIDRIASLKNIPPDMRQPVASMQASTERMMRLINQLMSYRMAQQGTLQLHLEQTEVVGFLRDIYLNFYLWAERKHVALDFKMTHRSYTMPADRWVLEMVAYNLFSNAIKYTPQGGHITIRVAVENGQMVFTVADDGIGVTPERREHLFDSYLHTSFSSANSAGIGLHFTRTLVELHHGTIAYSPAEPSGSIFTVTLPAGESDYAPDEFMTAKQQADREAIAMPAVQNAQPADALATASHPLNDRCVLIVEDDELLRNYMRSLLSQYFHVETSDDGVDAIKRIEQHKPDLVVSDVMMSVLDGYELLNHIRANETTRSLPVILLSALTTNEKRVRAMKLGADAYLTKPFDTNVLITTCQSLLQRHAQLKQSFAGEVVDKKQALPEIVVEQRDSKFLKDLENLTSGHLTDPQLSVDYLSEKLGMGRTLFFKRVKNLTGLTPADYIRSIRMQKAAELLANDKLTVAEVSYQVGIDDAHYFIKLFKQMYGITPKKYQKGQNV